MVMGPLGWAAEPIRNVVHPSKSSILMPQIGLMRHLETKVDRQTLNRHRKCYSFRCEANKDRQHLGMSLYRKFQEESLPMDGETLTPQDQCCDPYANICKTPMHVWESRCTRCNGSGIVTTGGRSRSRRGMRRRLMTCLNCSGIGYIRHVTSTPPDNFESSEGLITLNRREPEPFNCIVTSFSDFPESE